MKMTLELIAVICSSFSLGFGVCTLIWISGISLREARSSKKRNKGDREPGGGKHD